MRTALVYKGEVLAGTLTEENKESYVFRYDPHFLSHPEYTSISLTLSKTQAEHRSSGMFPFFSNLITEGINLSLQSRMLNIDPGDIMGLLLATAGADTIGDITLKPDTPNAPH